MGNCEKSGQTESHHEIIEEAFRSGNSHILAVSRESARSDFRGSTTDYETMKNKASRVSKFKKKSEGD